MLNLVAAGVVAYGAVAGVLYATQRSLLYFPHAGAVEPAEWDVPEMAPFEVATRDGLMVTGWYGRPRDVPEDRPVVLVFHGNAGHLGMRAFKARLLMDAGYPVVLAGYRGFGGNPGRPTEQGLYADGKAALDHLEGEGVPAHRIVLYGESLGTGVAVQIASEARVAGVVLEAPYTSIPDVGAVHFPWLPVRLLMHDRFDNLSKIGRVRAPLLVIHGERDRTVPVRFGRRLFDAASEPKRAFWVAEAGHNDLYDHGAGNALLAFLAGLETPDTGP